MSKAKVILIILGSVVVLGLAYWGYKHYQSLQYDSIDAGHIDQRIDTWKSNAKEGDRLDIVIYDDEQDKSNDVRKDVMKKIKENRSDYKNSEEGLNYDAVSIDMQETHRDIVNYDLGKAVKDGKPVTPSIVVFYKKDGQVKQDFVDLNKEKVEDM